MNQQVQNIVISGGVSLIVSLFTFTLGLKSGKNQSDRQLHRNKYRDISVHFNEMLNKLQTTNPKKWSNYKSIQVDLNTYQSMPLLVEMKSNGESIELNKNIIDESEQLELDLLRYAEKYYNQFDKIKEYIISNLSICCNSIKMQGNYLISTMDNPIGIPQHTVNYGIIIMKESLDKICYQLRNNEKYGISFQSKSKDGQGYHTVTIFNNTLKNKTVEGFLLETYNYFQKNDKDIKDLYEERCFLTKRTEKLINKVNKKVKEPFSFIETFFGAIIDIFKI